mmetsp:Transcript_14909/g.41304  ORF Transcript_14909/g.41304 Transcript_14909/m.41304 type:complete len:209 (-) Transcript_14909:444-1070(-)
MFVLHAGIDAELLNVDHIFHVFLHVLHEGGHEGRAFTIGRDDDVVTHFLGQLIPGLRHVLVGHFIDDGIHHEQQGVLHDLGEFDGIELTEDIVDGQQLLRHEIEADGGHLACLGGDDALPADDAPGLILQPEQLDANEFERIERQLQGQDVGDVAHEPGDPWDHEVFPPCVLCLESHLVSACVCIICVCDCACLPAVAVAAAVECLDE